MNLQFLQHIVKEINDNTKSKIKVKLFPTIGKELEVGSKLLRDKEEMYNSLINWLKIKEKEGVNKQTKDFYKDTGMKGDHWKKIKHVTFQNPNNRLALFYQTNGSILYLLAVTPHKDYEGNNKKQVSLASKVVKRYQQFSESVSQKTFSEFLNEVQLARRTLLAPDPTREDLKRVSDENIERILKKAKANPRDLTQAEKHVLFALGKK